MRKMLGMSGDDDEHPANNSAATELAMIDLGEEEMLTE
jgi:hypothetical protein